MGFIQADQTQKLRVVDGRHGHKAGNAGFFVGAVQKLSQLYSYYAGDSELAEKASIYGALTLYLDFINIFLYVVRLLGLNSRNSRS